MMRINNIRTLLTTALALAVAAISCNRVDLDIPTPSDNAIRISAVDGATTKALLEKETDEGGNVTSDDFNSLNNEIRVYDVYTGIEEYGIQNMLYINGDIAKYSQTGQARAWDFQYVNDRPQPEGSYVWHPGTHTFFGWFAKDATTFGTDNSMTPETFFGNGNFQFSFAESETSDEGASYGTLPATLTIGGENGMTIDASTTQFDFMYSNVVTVNTEATGFNKENPADVNLSFSHLFTAVSLSVQNNTGSTVTITGLGINGLQNTKSATITFPAVSGNDQTHATVSYTPSDTPGSLAWTVSGDDQALENSGTLIVNPLIMWEQTEDDKTQAIFSVSVDGETNPRVSQPTAIQWLPGKKYHYTLILESGEEPGVTLSSNVTVSDWGQTGVYGDPNAEGRGDFFFVDCSNIVLENRNSASVRVTSSGPWKYEVLSATYPVYYKDADFDGVNDYPDGALLGIGTVENKTIIEAHISYSISPAITSGTLDSSVKQITLTNILNNNINSDNFNFTPITFKIKAGLVDDDNTYIDNSLIKPVIITITQNPAVYVIADLNSDAEMDENGNYINITEEYPWWSYNTPTKICYGVGSGYSFYGYILVNGYYGHYNSKKQQEGVNYSSDTYYISYPPSIINKERKGVSLLGDSGSIQDGRKAPYMYVISISDISGTNYVIGDPRQATIDNLNENTWGDPIINTEVRWFAGQDLDGNIRELSYYYPTEASIQSGLNSRTYNMLAPKFRVSSGFGATGEQNRSNETVLFRQYYNGVKARCAAYQEDGRPAGRWRLPTKAEVEVMNTLSIRGLIYPIFNDGGRYWCAHGIWHGESSSILLGNDDSLSPSDISVRCVYDEWYWEQIDSQSKYKDYFEQNENGFYQLKDGDGKNDFDGSNDNEDSENYRKLFFWGDRPR